MPVRYTVEAGSCDEGASVSRELRAVRFFPVRESMHSWESPSPAITIPSADAATDE